MRLLHRLYAKLFGYFWLPCPICGEYFGGHEKGQGCLYDDWHRGRGTCSNCAEEARVRSLDVLRNMPMPIVEIPVEGGIAFFRTGNDEEDNA